MSPWTQCGLLLTDSPDGEQLGRVSGPGFMPKLGLQIRAQGSSTSPGLPPPGQAVSFCPLRPGEGVRGQRPATSWGGGPTLATAAPPGQGLCSPLLSPSPRQSCPHRGNSQPQS